MGLETINRTMMATPNAGVVEVPRRSALRLIM